MKVTREERYSNFQADLIVLLMKLVPLCMIELAIRIAKETVSRTVSVGDFHSFQFMSQKPCFHPITI